MIINKNDYPDVFCDNEELAAEDVALFKRALPKAITSKEREFLEKMHDKETGEFAAEADRLMSEHDNTDELYIIRYYFTDYRIGRGLVGRRCSECIYLDSLAKALAADLHPLLGRHVTLLDWLRERDFQGINYQGNFQFDH